MARGSKSNKPHEHGPRLFRRGRWWGADLRPWGGPRITLRKPGSPGWPKRGERTEDREVAERWKWAYVDAEKDANKRRLLGYGGPPDSLGETLDRWMAHREHTVEEGTYASSGTVQVMMEEYFGRGVPVSDVGAGELQGMFNDLRARGYAISTLVTRKGYLSAFYTWLGITPNPAVAVDLPAKDRSRAEAWTDGQIETIRGAADKLVEQGGAVARRMVETALATGARESEMFALRLEDFDPDAKVVHILRQLGRYKTTTTGLKGDRPRTAVVLPFYWQHHPEGEGLAFPSKRDPSKPLHRSERARLIERVLDTAGLNEPGTAYHKFRHTYARLFIEAGGDPWMLAESMGHASVRTTETQYGHFRGNVAVRMGRAAIYGTRGLRLED